ncbi:MAG: MFS transporter [Lachnospiraceae bacterium]|nr:MFS transporter [Lachnospiraceae bacterium]
MKSKFSVQTYVGIVLLSLSGAAIYLLPYLRWSYYDALMEASGLNNTQFGVTMSVFGVLAMIFYPVGGLAADRFSAKKLLSIAVIGSGILGVWYSTFPSYMAQVVIYAGWGVLSTLTFWAAMMKATRQLGSSDEQGRLFGLVEGGRGVLSTIVSFAALFAFSKMGEGLGGLKGIIVAMSVVNIVTGILIFFFLKEGQREDVKEEGQKKLQLSDIVRILKMPAIWLISLIIICCYSVYLGSTYLTPYFTNVIGATASFAALLSIMRTYVLQFLGAPTGGMLADKIGSITKVINGCYVVMIAALVLIILLPSTKGAMIPLIIVLLALCGGIFAMRGIYFATIDEVDIPIHVTGTAVGIVSIIGFMPDVFISALCGKFLDVFEGAAGYRAIFIMMLAFAVVGLISTMLLLKLNKRGRANERTENK